MTDCFVWTTHSDPFKLVLTDEAPCDDRDELVQWVLDEIRSQETLEVHAGPGVTRHIFFSPDSIVGIEVRTKG